MKLSTNHAKERNEAIYRYMQRGLIYPAPFARFCAFWTQPQSPSRLQIAEIVKNMRKKIHKEFGSNHTTITVAVSFELYKHWCKEDGGSIPKGMALKSDQNLVEDVFKRGSHTYAHSAIDVWVYIRSDKEQHLAGVYNFLLEQMNPFLREDKAPVYQDANRRATRNDQGGRVLGCRFSENLNNPTDPITIAGHALIGYEDQEHLGGSFVLAQRFEINWDQLHNMSETQIEDLIGRTYQNTILPTNDTRTHIHSARFRDPNGNTRFILRLGLPFGTSSLDSAEFQQKGANIRNEEGIYFVGLTKNIQYLEGIMNQQIGPQNGYMNDRLLSHVKANLGGFFYVPSRKDLGLDPINIQFDQSYFTTSDNKKQLDKEDHRKYFPGIDWTRFIRHFDEKSPNGCMYYNHKNYLYEMATMSKKAAKEYAPPSFRILELLSDSFSRWQDSWYFPKGQLEMEHLCAYIANDDEFGYKIAGEVMQSSIAIRKAWAIRMTCRLYASDAYGYRGKRSITKNGKTLEQEGADTYRINPKEIIVGAMPDLSLAQGRYVMDYQRAEEKMSNFFKGLSEASGVGHIVPDFQKLVDRGIGGLMNDIEMHAANIEEPEKQDFYRSCTIALLGIQDHLTRYADLAERRSKEMTEGQQAERKNLMDISARLRRLQTQPPATLLEATQLIFTVFTCLQLNAEPVAIGRLDQYLNSFYLDDLKAKRINKAQAQEIIDAFWIKIDEKVLQNRCFIKDHQPFGNLAIGGASGPYPQGASLGQWIQQVTVGGVIANDEKEATLAYNDVTHMCIKAAARLPLNAPCLSLRVSSKTPDSILRMAAKAILSGGAHPILLNDDKIIPGLQQSGDDVGTGAQHDTKYVPIAEKTNGRWDSKVSLSSARNYACDGCYEPMFAGQNWFSLGGFSTLDPLECALNQGRLYGSAGPVFLKGQNRSFRSDPPTAIKTFDALVELYLKHFHYLWAKTFNDQLGNFDRLVGICPSPLLSILIDDCLTKGLDLYGGGARYNVYGPCFVALSSTINSLYNIKQMVFHPQTAETSLVELVECLMCDWGHSMVEPFISSLAGQSRITGRAERFHRLRDSALSYERYGEGAKRPSYLAPYDPNDLMTYSVDQLGNYLTQKIAHATLDIFRNPYKETAKKMFDFAIKYGTQEHPFGGFQIQPGTGTFENFIAFGGGSGASADGRRSSEAIASDLSPSPNSMDKPAQQKSIKLEKAIRSYDGCGSAAFWNGAPTDFNISEDFPFEKLVSILRDFADGHGSNILTITCVSPETFNKAPNHPEKYDLLRVRMGGWSEFFTSMFPLSQEQHLRRPIAQSKNIL